MNRSLPILLALVCLMFFDGCAELGKPENAKKQSPHKKAAPVEALSPGEEIAHAVFRAHMKKMRQTTLVVVARRKIFDSQHSVYITDKTQSLVSGDEVIRSIDRGFHDGDYPPITTAILIPGVLSGKSMVYRRAVAKPFTMYEIAGDGLDLSGTSIPVDQTDRTKWLDQMMALQQGMPQALSFEPRWEGDLSPVVMENDAYRLWMKGYQQWLSGATSAPWILPWNTSCKGELLVTVNWTLIEGPTAVKLSALGVGFAPVPGGTMMKRWLFSDISRGAMVDRDVAAGSHDQAYTQIAIAFWDCETQQLLWSSLFNQCGLIEPSDAGQIIGQLFL